MTTYRIRRVRHYTLSDILFVAAYVVLFLGIFGMVAASCEQAAHADVPLISTGPSVGFTRIGWKAKDPTRLNLGNDTSIDALAAALGWALRINPPKLCKNNVCYMSWDFTLFANVSGLPTSGGISLATGPSFYNGLGGFQVQYNLISGYDVPGRGPEGLFTGNNGGIRNLAFLFTVSTNLLIQKLMGSPSKVGVSGPPPPNYGNPFRR